MDNVLLFFALKYQGNWEKIYLALEQKEKISHEELIKVQTRIECNFFTIISPLYPINLKNAHKPPFVLFACGNLNLLGNYHQIIGVSGSEKFNEYGQQNTVKIVQELILENRIILTGDNQGLESLIIETTLKNHGRLIIVTKQGLKNYLTENQDLIKRLEKEIDFLIVTETYETPTENSETAKYYARLKIGLMKVLLFTQITTTSEEYQMTNFALNDGKDIFALPEPLNSKFNGNNLLIKQGAKMVDSVKDLLNEI